MILNYHQIRSTGAMLLGNIDTWVRNSKTYLMFIFMLLVSYMTIKGFGNGILSRGYFMHYSEAMTWYLMSGFNGFSLTSLAFLVMVSELPRKIPFQQYTIIRATRWRWMGNQILYCLILVVVMMLVLVLLASVFVQAYVTPGDGWSDDVRIAGGMEEEMALIPSWIRLHFTPWQAMALSAVPIFLFWFTMVLTVLLFSLLGIPSVGVSLYAIILFSSLTFTFENFQDFEPPMTFSTLSRIGSGYEDAYIGRLTCVFVTYGLIIIALTIIILLVARRMDIPTYALNKD